MIALRQVALVAAELAPVRAQLFRLLGLQEDYDDPGVGEFGLHNSVMVIGNTFLEVVAPKVDGTAAGRLLDRRGGDGGYMVLAQVDDFDAVSRRIESLGWRRVWEIDRDEVTACHVHPRDIGAAIVSFDEMRPADDWLWAGPGWRDRAATNVDAISAVDVQSTDPAALADRWSSAFGASTGFSGDAIVMPLDEGEIRFTGAVDGRGDGVAGVTFRVADPDALRAAAKAENLDWHGNRLFVCGTWLTFEGLS